MLSTLELNKLDRCADYAYHNGRLYIVTYYGVVESSNLGEAKGQQKRCLLPKGNMDQFLLAAPCRHRAPGDWRSDRRDRGSWRGRGVVV